MNSGFPSPFSYKFVAHNRESLQGVHRRPSDLMSMRRMSKVFFSSCFDDPGGQRLRIRDCVLQLNGQFDKNDKDAIAALPVWMAECHRDLDRAAQQALFVEPKSVWIACGIVVSMSPWFEAATDLV